jgi:hypothetical protein
VPTRRSLCRPYSAMESHCGMPPNGSAPTTRSIWRQYGESLRYALEALRTDHEILPAMQRHGSALRHASGDLRADHEFVLAAVQLSGAFIAVCLGGASFRRQCSRM